MYQKADNAVEKSSVLDEVDFQFDLLFSDRINVDYIMDLLAKEKNQA